jgi:hypothetical protein
MSPERHSARTTQSDDDAGTNEPTEASPAGITGYIDIVSGRRISGWVWDPAQPERRFDVAVFVDDVGVATVRADRLRQDLAKSGIGDGRYGFEAQAKTPIGDNDRHRVTAYVENDEGSESIPLMNHAARVAKISVLKPDDVVALRLAIEEWPEERRELQDQLIRYLQAVAVELRGVRNALQGGDAKAGDDDEGPVTDSIDAVRRMQDELSRRISEIDVFHNRFDTALTEISRDRKTASAPPETNGMQRIVLALGVLSGLSLLLGIYSVLR